MDFAGDYEDEVAPSCVSSNCIGCTFCEQGCPCQVGLRLSQIVEEFRNDWDSSEVSIWRVGTSPRRS